MVYKGKVVQYGLPSLWAFHLWCTFPTEAKIYQGKYMTK